MKKLAVSMLLLVSTLACGPIRTAQADTMAAPPVSAVARAVRPVPWVTRDRSVKLFTRAKKRLQLIALSGPYRGEAYVYLISEGTVVESYFHTRTQRELADLTAEVVEDLTMPEVQSPALAIYYGSTGAVSKKPTPDPPPSPITPAGAIEQAMQTAWDLDQQMLDEPDIFKR